MSTVEFVSVNGLGGAFEVGAVQAGMTLRHRTGSLSLGAPVVESNRTTVGWDWESEFTDDCREWRRLSIPVILANPPCSAWSTMTRKDLRGADAKVLSCTQEVIDYAALQNDPPLVVAIESVQQAFGLGRGYYQGLREQLSERTGYDYDLVWVKQSNASLGGCSVRKRVFVVYARIPFGVEWARPARVATLGDATRDLQGLELTAHRQPYRRPATWWSVPLRAEDGVDGHFAPEGLQEVYTRLLRELDAVGVTWPHGKDTTHVLRELWAAGGTVPPPWNRKLDRLVAGNFVLSINQTSRWDPEKQAKVLTGAGPFHSVHYSEPRMLTYRECARIQGFPDTWRIWPVRDYKHLGAVWGKGVPVDAGRWISRWTLASVSGEPGSVYGSPIGERERLVDVTDTYKGTIWSERPWEHQRFVPHEHGHWIEQELLAD